MVSAVILLLGLAIVAAVLLSGDRRRERAASSVAVGDDSAAVIQRLGAQPIRCPTGNMLHVESRFPGGTPRTTREAVQERLRLHTAQRWIYPGEARGSGCTPLGGDTEIGFGRDGRVLWLVPVSGRDMIVLPDTVSI